MAEQCRLIKKYPNRRLYDTRTSTYITLADIKQFVLRHENFQVADARTGGDLTRGILLQVLLEEESAGTPMLTADLLARMIRLYGNAMEDALGRCLESSLKAFAEMQAEPQE